MSDMESASPQPKITVDELAVIFGSEIPVDVMNFLFGPASAKLSLAEVRAELRKMAVAAPSPDPKPLNGRWVTVRVQDTCDGLLINEADAKAHSLEGDRHYPGHFLPDGRYRINIASPADMESATKPDVSVLIEQLRGHVTFAEGERVSVRVDIVQAAINALAASLRQSEDLDVARGLNANLGARVIAVTRAAQEFQRVTQDRINRSFAEAAYDPRDWRRAERDLLSACQEDEGR